MVSSRLDTDEQLPPVWQVHVDMRVAESEREQLAARIAMIEEWRRNARDLPTYPHGGVMRPKLSRVIGAGVLLAGLVLGGVIVLASLLLALLPWAA